MVKEIIITSQRRFEDVKGAIEFAKKGGTREIRVVTAKGDVVMSNPDDLKKFLPVEKKEAKE